MRTRLLPAAGSRFSASAFHPHGLIVAAVLLRAESTLQKRARKTIALPKPPPSRFTFPWPKPDHVGTQGLSADECGEASVFSWAQRRLKQTGVPLAIKQALLAVVGHNTAHVTLQNYFF